MVARPPTYVCTTKGCGRVVQSHDREFPLWLIARRVDDPAKLVVRCPQHITDRTLRYAGIERSIETFRNVRSNRTKDERYKHSALPPGAIIEVDPILLRMVLGTGSLKYDRSGKYAKEYRSNPIPKDGG